MKKVFIEHGRFLSKVLIVLLIVMNLYNWLDGRFIFWITFMNLVLFVVAFTILQIRTNDWRIKRTLTSSVLDLTSKMLKAKSNEEFYEMILLDLIALVDGVEKGSIITIKDGDLWFEAVVGFDLDQVRKMNLKLEDTVLMRTNKELIPKSVVVKNIALYNEGRVSEESLVHMKNAGIESILSTVSTPILVEDRLIGMINLDSVKSEGFKSKEIHLVEAYSIEMAKIISLYRLFEKTINTSKYDDLTKVLNRASFKEIVDTSVLEEREQVVIGYFDLDNLKRVNDKYGHDVGDRYIKTFTDGLLKHLTGEELLARFGGDEFVMLYLRPEESFESFKGECKKWFEKNPILLNNQSIIVQFSVGFAVYPDHGLSLADLIKDADMKMYQDKSSKRRV